MSLVHEQGKPVTEAGGEIHHLIHGLNYYADLATKVRGSYQPLPSALSKAYGMVLRRPMGVVAAIVPNNFPLTLLGTKLAPALMAGNTIVVKPAATTPLTTLKIADLLLEAEFPPGVVNVITGKGSEVGDALVTHDLVRRVAFTGSTAVGRHIMGLAAPKLKRMTMELGGSRPGDRLPRRQHQGRRARDRHRPLLELRPDVPRRQAHLRLRRGLRRADGAADAHRRQVRARPRLGEGREAEHPRRPAAHRRGARRDHGAAAGRARRRRRAACSAATSPRARATSCSPTIVTNPALDSRVAREETFGPVLPIWRVSDLDEAIGLANDTEYGLGASVWTNDIRIINRVANEVDAGMKWVNQFHYGYDELPFGGVKQSGYGKEHGMEGLDYYLEDISRRHRRARVMAVTYEPDGAVGYITLDKPPANSYD